LAIARRRQQHKHRLWVRDIYRDRETFGEYHHLYPQLREDEDKFFEYFRMSIATFDLLLSKISHRLQKRSIRQAITPEERLVLTLRYLATGNSFASLSFSFRIAKCTVCLIVRECCRIIVEELGPQYQKFPTTTEEWQEIAQDYWDRWQFPNCIGAIDGSVLFYQHKCLDLV